MISLNTLKQKTSTCVKQQRELKNLYALKSELASIHVGPSLPSMKKKTPKVLCRRRSTSSTPRTVNTKEHKLQPMSQKFSSSNSKMEEDQGSFSRKAYTNTMKKLSRRNSALEQIKTSMINTPPKRQKTTDVNSIDGLVQSFHGFEFSHFKEKETLDDDVEVENVTVPVVLPSFQAQVIDQKEVKTPRKTNIESIFTSYLYSNCRTGWNEVEQSGVLDTDTLNLEEFIAVRNFVNKFTKKVNSLCRRCKNI